MGNYKLAIVQKSFTDDQTGEITPYKRLALSGSIGGEIMTLEIKLTKAELMLANIIMNNSEDLKTVQVK